MASRKTPNEITVDEVIALLKKTSLPTLVVEGSDDMIVYRRFEDSLAHIGVSVLPVGGRRKVLEVFNRRAEIPTSVRTMFIADQDTWVNSGIPSAYTEQSLLFTDGYSIENDVYRDGELWTLLQVNERHAFETELAHFIEWYALAVSRHLLGTAQQISLHPDHVLDPLRRPALLALQPAESYPTALKQEIHGDYGRLLRGKSLLALLLKHTNAKGRGVRHSDSGLFEMVAVRPGALLIRLRQQIERHLGAP